MGILKMLDTFLQLLEHGVWRVNILGAFQQIVNFLIKAAQEGASLFIEVLCLCHLVSKFFQNFTSFFVSHESSLLPAIRRILVNKSGALHPFYNFSAYLCSLDIILNNQNLC